MMSLDMFLSGKCAITLAPTAERFDFVDQPLFGSPTIEPSRSSFNQ